MIETAATVLSLCIGLGVGFAIMFLIMGVIELIIDHR
jgi:hypothetical protein